MLLASAADPSYGSRLGHVLLVLALCGLSARRGYVKALAFERSHGAGPRGWEPVSWSIVCFSLLVFGHALLGSSLKQPPPRRTTEPRPPVQDPFSWGPPAAAVPAQAWAPPPVVAAAPVAQNGSDAPGESLPMCTSEHPVGTAAPVQVPAVDGPVEQVVVAATPEPAFEAVVGLVPEPVDLPAAPSVAAPAAQALPQPAAAPASPPAAEVASAVASEPVARRAAIDVLPGR